MALKILLSMILIPATLFAQTRLSGIYKNKESYVQFLSDSTVEFKTLYGCCLLTDIFGTGYYSVQNDRLVILTKNAPLVFKARIFTSQNLNNPNAFKMVFIDSEGNEQDYIVPVLRNLKDSKFAQKIDVDTIQNVAPNIIHKTRQYYIDIHLIGMDRLKLPLDSVLGKSVVISLSHISAIEDCKVEFDIKDSSSIPYLLGPFLEDDRQRIANKKTHAPIPRKFTK
jgi:hypothetical protein